MSKTERSPDFFIKTYASKSAEKGQEMRKTLNFPDRLCIVKIGDCAFSGCVNPTSVTLNKGVAVVERLAFGGCSALKSISFPSSLSRVGFDAFYACTALKSVYYSGTLTQWCAVDFVASPFMTGGERFCLSNKPVTVAEIPEGVTSIGSNMKKALTQPPAPRRRKTKKAYEDQKVHRTLFFLAFTASRSPLRV